MSWQHVNVFPTVDNTHLTTQGTYGPPSHNWSYCFER